MRLLLISVSLLLASGCAKKYCEQERPYDSAQEYPTLSAPPGMEVPEPDPNLKIPPASGDEQAVLNESRECLEIPPRIQVNEE